MTSRVDSPRDLVYGAAYGDEDSLIFLPRARAIELADTHDALSQATMWRDLRDRMPPLAYDRFLTRLIEYYELVSFDAYYTEELRKEPQLSKTDARARYLALAPYTEREPEDDDLFEFDKIGFLMDGDFPEWPAQEMLDWIPKSIQEQFGRRGASFVSGPCLLFSAADEQALIKAFGGDSFSCERDDTLVLSAQGL